jgi:PAS domain S-box-containing protein
MTGGRPVDALLTDDARAIVSALPDAVFLLEPVRGTGSDVVELVWRYANAAAVEMLGRPVDEIVGHGLREMFPAPHQDPTWSENLALLGAGHTVHMQVPWPGADGEVHTLALRARPFGGMVLVTGRDITERVRAQQQLREGQDELRRERDFNKAILDVARALIVVLDADWRIVRFNRYCESLTGYREDEVVGRHYAFLIPPEELTTVADTVAPVSPGQPVSQINHWLTKSGELRLILWTNAGLADADGRRTYTIAIGVDITDLRKAEDELTIRAAQLEIANRELARSNEDLERFAYVASHDLTEPLRAVAGPLEFLAQQYPGKVLDATATEFINYAIDGCRRMQSMIEGLLALSRVGRIERAIGAVDAAEVVQHVIASLAPAIEQAQAGVTASELPVVLAEPDQLAQVFRNLIGNAIKFVEPGVAPEVVVAAERVGDTWRFTITDNGIGVPPKERDRAFAVFGRLQAPEDYPGSGIGLAIVKKIVERHGGEVGVEDAPGGTGSRFWFTLPVTRTGNGHADTHPTGHVDNRPADA